MPEFMLDKGAIDVVLRAAGVNVIGFTGDGGVFASGIRTLPKDSFDRSSASSSSKKETTGTRGEDVCGDGEAAKGCEAVDLLGCAREWVEDGEEGLGEESAAKRDWETSERRREARFWLFENLSEFVELSHKTHSIMAKNEGECGDLRSTFLYLIPLPPDATADALHPARDTRRCHRTQAGYARWRWETRRKPRRLKG